MGRLRSLVEWIVRGRQLDLDASSVSSHRVHGLKGLAVDRLDAGRQIVLPTVPWTGDAAVGDVALGQRSALVAAHAVDRIPPSLVTEDGEDAFAQHDLSGESFALVEAVEINRQLDCQVPSVGSDARL